MKNDHLPTIQYTAEIKVIDGDGKLKFTQKNTYNATGKIIRRIANRTR